MYIALSIQPFRSFLFITLENILKRESLTTFSQQLCLSFGGSMCILLYSNLF